MRMRYCATCLVLALCVSTVRADVPNLLGWQGVVLDSLDQPITSGEYSMRFAVYSDAVGGDSLWGESQLVMVQDGVANVLLGSSVPLPDTLFDDSLRFLQVQFENESPYTPRIQLVSVGFAHRVQSVHGARGGVITGDVDIDEDLVVAGGIRSGSKATFGPNNTNTGMGGFVTGTDNSATGMWTTISGGHDNVASGSNTTIAGGVNNTASDLQATVGGGLQNTASGIGATVPGGYYNTALGDYSFAAGVRARAHHAGSFVWADTQNVFFVSTAPGQFLIRAHGGVGIGTSAPTEALEVAGTIYSSAGGIRFPDGSVQTSAWSQPPSGWAKLGSVVRLDAIADSVGIGTNTPTEKLEVDGNIKTSGTIELGGSLRLDGSTDVISGSSGRISFGGDDIATSGRATLGPGNSNTGTGTFVFGQNNTISGLYGTITGGRDNSSNGTDAVISGGRDNTANATFATISGGWNNTASHTRASVGGGQSNNASEAYSTISGGHINSAAGPYSTIPGGRENTASGSYSFAAGFRAKANHDGAFVWADTGSTAFVSTGANQFLIRADGGVGIGTNAPDVPLHIKQNGGTYAGVANTIMALEPVSGTRDAGLALTTTRGSGRTYQLRAGIGYAGASNNLVIYDHEVGMARLSLDTLGNLAIGRWVPDYRLHVDGGTIYNGWLHGSDNQPNVLVENLHDGVTSGLSPGIWGMASSAGSNGSAFKMALAGIAKGDAGVKYGVYGNAQGAGGTKYAVYGTVSGSGTNYAGYFVGNAHVTGTLSKGAGSFKIDHPLDPENKYLYHSFVESPDMMNVYNGNVTLDASGTVTIELPEYFEALNRDFRYQLTAIGQAAPNLHVASRVEDGRFSIGGGSPGMEVSWQVTGIRKDAFAEAHRIPVEEIKPASERGRYLHPIENGLTRDRGIHAHQLPVSATGEQEVR